MAADCRSRMNEAPSAAERLTKKLLSITAFSALGVLLAIGSPIKHPILTLQLAVAEPPASLPVPVDGIRPSAIRDSWRAPRDGGRHHQGVDIFAKAGTPVRSTTEGLVIGRGQNRLGGNVVWIMGPGRQTHYYAHLSDFGAFEVGDRVLAGDIIGYVGDTGNARGTPHHLHYGVYELGGTAINPFSLLTSNANRARA